MRVHESGPAPAAHVHAIEAEGLRREFPGGVVAVDGIDLAVPHGEIFGVLGPNGAGKSTIVRMLTTLLRPSAGRAAVAGFDLRREPREIRRSIGVALQEAGLDPIATGRELLIVQAQLFGMGSGQAKRRAEELLELVGLVEAADRRVKTYSGGMKRRLDLASALVHRPSILFLDEPTEGLDPASRQTLWQEVELLNAEFGVTVLLTTHYMEEADRLADRLAIVDRGRIVAEGTPAALKASIGAGRISCRPARPRSASRAPPRCASSTAIVTTSADEAGLTLFVSDGSTFVASVIRALDSAAVPIGAVSVSQPSLDEVFLQATGSRLEGAESEQEEVS